MSNQNDLNISVRISEKEAQELEGFLKRMLYRNISDEDRRTIYWLQNALYRAVRFFKG